MSIMTTADTTKLDNLSAQGGVQNEGGQGLGTVVSLVESVAASVGPSDVTNLSVATSAGLADSVSRSTTVLDYSLANSNSISTNTAASTTTSANLSTTTLDYSLANSNTISYVTAMSTAASQQTSLAKSLAASS